LRYCEITFFLALWLTCGALCAWLVLFIVPSQQHLRFTLQTPASRHPTRTGNSSHGGRSFVETENPSAHTPDADLQRKLDAEILRRQEAERKLESAILEKETLVKEIHHRVKNNLAIVATLLDMAARGIQDPQALNALDNSKGRILAMAMIHEQLYNSQDLTSIDLGAHISRLASDLIFAYSNNPAIRLDVKVETVMIDLERAIPCGLIVNELITNAFKYGYPNGEAGVIGVSVRMVGSQIEVSVSDDGVRLPDTVFNGKTKSLGMDLVRILSYQLRATLDIQRDGITSFVIRFPFIDPEA
jgi:two-component sensor histidine kinase